MDLFTLKVAVAVFIVCAHFGILVLSFLLYLAHGFTFEEMTTIIGLIGPLFAGYTTIVLTFMSRVQGVRPKVSKSVGLSFVFTTLLSPILFTLALASCVVLKAYNIGFANFDQFKTMVGVVQTAFGVYVGQFVVSLFEADARRVERQKAERAKAE
jgi:hypothetical protein